MKNSADLRGCYPPRPSALVDNTLLDLQNSSYPTQPHSIIANYCNHVTTFPSFLNVRMVWQSLRNETVMSDALLLGCQYGKPSRNLSLISSFFNFSFSFYFLFFSVSVKALPVTPLLSGVFVHRAFFAYFLRIEKVVGNA